MKARWLAGCSSESSHRGVIERGHQADRQECLWRRDVVDMSSRRLGNGCAPAIRQQRKDDRCPHVGHTTSHYVSATTRHAAAATSKTPDTRLEITAAGYSAG